MMFQYTKASTMLYWCQQAKLSLDTITSLDYIVRSGYQIDSSYLLH